MTDMHTANVCAIRQKSTGYWWGSSIEHGTGWNKRIRQAWTLREASLEVMRMIERGWFSADVEIVELGPRGREGTDG